MPTVAQSRIVTLPIGHEKSSLSSNRESDSPLRLYHKFNKNNAQFSSDVQALQAALRQLERMRRRILGGGAQASQAQGAFRGEYDGTATYSLYDEVVVSSGDNRGTYIYIYQTSSSGNDPWLGGGYWMQKPGGPVAQWL